MKNKILIIDDEANKGWKAILGYLLFENHQVDSATTINKARDLIAKYIYDIIFLDLRFGEKDHQTNKLKEFGGYELIEKVRENFLSENFATPVILFTASNKAWFINGMLDAGCDDYYIKEHPDTAYDQEFTKQNTKRLKETVATLLIENRKRKSIHNKIKAIVEKSQNEIKNENIRTRITEKLKIGYGILFKKNSAYEENKLLFNNEVLSFITLWSILEELSHFLFKTNSYSEWELKRSEKNIQYWEDEQLYSYFKTIENEYNNPESIKDERADEVTLSKRISAILRYDCNWSHHQIRSGFSQKLNKYRNKTNFIHSQSKSIFNKTISQNYDKEEAFNKCEQVLNFINTLLNKDRQN